MSSNVKELLIIYDDKSSQYQFPGSLWEVSIILWYGGTLESPIVSNETQGVYGSFSLEFEGISVAFFGYTAKPTQLQYATYSIDNGPRFNSSYGGGPLNQYKQWWISPPLAEGNHTVNVTSLDGTKVDFALVTAGPNTPLDGTTVLVDDDDASLRYIGGGWVASSAQFHSGIHPDGNPVRNTTHHSATPGDMVFFPFTGTSIAVYAIFAWDKLGTFSATYTIDGVHVTPETIVVNASTQEYITNVGEATNHLLFSLDALSPGNHTLLINITECDNQMLMLDYLTYSPSFPTLKDMPDLTSITLPHTASNVNGTISANATATATPSSMASDEHLASKKVPVGPIVGGTCAGLVVLTLLLLFFYRRYRMKNAPIQENLTTGAAFGPSSRSLTTSSGRTGGVDPFILEGRWGLSTAITAATKTDLHGSHREGTINSSVTLEPSTYESISREHSGS